MRYDAFISYRHTEPDMEIAKAVHKGLETFKVPGAVRKSSGKKRINRVFRDQEELPIGSDLTDNIDHALDESEYLIVICSPNTPGSEWVQKEIDYFLAHHSRDHALAVLVDGEPWESFPKALLTDEKGNPVEPLAADVRGTTRSERKKKLKTELMRLAAPLLSCSYDDLRQRHRERRMRKTAAAFLLIALFGVAFGLYSTYNAKKIEENYQAKLENQSKYLASTSLALLEQGDRRAAALIAAQALPSEGNERPFVPAAGNALASALHVYDSGDWISFDRILQHDMPVKDFMYNKDMTMVTSQDSGGNVYVWDLETGERLVKIIPELNDRGTYVDIFYANVVGDELIMVSAEAITIYDLNGECREQENFERMIVTAKVGHDEDLVVCEIGDSLVIYSIENGHITPEKTLAAPSDTSLGVTCAMSDDSRYFAISNSLYDERRQVLLYDLENQTVKTIYPCNDRVSDLMFTRDDKLVIASRDQAGLYSYSDEAETGGKVELYDANGYFIWEADIPAGMSVDFSGGFRIYEHYYDADERSYDAVIAVMDNVAYSFDPRTGENYCVIPLSNNVQKLQALNNSNTIMLGLENGDIIIADPYTGNTFPNSVIKMNMDLLDFVLNRGILIGRKYASPNLYVMRFLKSPTLEDFADTDYYTVGQARISENRKYLMVQTWGDELAQLFYFYDLSDGDLRDMLAPETEESIQFFGYISADEVAFVDVNGNVYVYDIPSGDFTSVRISHAPDFDEERCCGGAVLPDSRLWFYTDKQIVVYDMDQQKLLYQFPMDDHIRVADISPDGRYALAYAAGAKLYYIDMEEGEKTKVDIDGTMNGYGTGQITAFSEDGKLFAVACIDGLLKVFDRETLEMIAEIPCSNKSRGFIAFSPDNKDVLMQGDDYYFKVYDLEQQEFIYLAEEQYSMIQRVEYYDEAMAGLIISGAVVLIDRETNEPLAEIEGGKAFDAEEQKIYAAANRRLVTYSYLSYQQLLEELENAFPGQELTIEERLRYHVD